MIINSYQVNNKNCSIINGRRQNLTNVRRLYRLAASCCLAAGMLCTRLMLAGLELPASAPITSSSVSYQHHKPQYYDICMNSLPPHTISSLLWWSGVVLASINEVNQRRAWLVLRWVTVFGFNSRYRTFISVCDQPPRSTQPGHPFVGRRNEYQPKGGDALRLRSKGRYGSCVGGR